MADSEGPRGEMQERVARSAAGGAQAIDRRLGELAPEPDSAAALEAQERCALKSLRGDFDGLPPLATPEEREEVASMEGEGGRSPGEGRAGCDRRDGAAVEAALRAAEL